MQLTGVFGVEFVRWIDDPVKCWYKLSGGLMIRDSLLVEVIR